MPNIKETALKVAGEVAFGLGNFEEDVTKFAEALVAELAKGNKPVAWCVGYDDPRMGRIHSNPTMYKPEAEALIKSTTSALIVCSLYPLPPTASQIEQETAEACSTSGATILRNIQQDNSMSEGEKDHASNAVQAFASAIRSGAWKEFKKS